MPSVYVHEHQVKPAETDWLGHANNVSYFHWLQDAAVGHSRAQGWPAERYAALGQTWVARRHSIEYLISTVAGDVIVVQTWVASLSRVTSTRKYRVIRLADQTIVAQAETMWAFIDIRTGAPCRIPKDVSSAFAIVEDPDHELQSEKSDAPSAL